MKRIIALLLTALLVVSLAACGKKSDDQTKDKTESATEAETAAETDAPIDGGWGDSQSVSVSDDVKAMFTKMNETLAGAQYEPIAYLSSQVVAGTNHLVLCKETATVPNAATTYAIVTVYEDLDGNAEITSIQNSEVAAPAPYDPENPVAGGWSEPESYELTDEAKAAFEKAVANLSGTKSTPLALLATQVVAGMNYRILAKATAAGTPEYMIVTVYEDPQGNAEITDTFSFPVDQGEEAEDGASASSQAE